MKLNVEKVISMIRRKEYDEDEAKLRAIERTHQRALRGHVRELMHDVYPIMREEAILLQRTHEDVSLTVTSSGISSEEMFTMRPNLTLAWGQEYSRRWGSLWNEAQISAGPDFFDPSLRVIYDTYRNVGVNPDFQEDIRSMVRFAVERPAIRYGASDTFPARLDDRIHLPIKKLFSPHRLRRPGGTTFLSAT